MLFSLDASYGAGSWSGVPSEYQPAAVPGYPPGYDYSAYYAQAAAAYGAYGQSPAGYPMPADPYAQQYAAAAAAAPAPSSGSKKFVIFYY